MGGNSQITSHCHNSVWWWLYNHYHNNHNNNVQIRQRRQPTTVLGTQVVLRDLKPNKTVAVKVMKNYSNANCSRHRRKWIFYHDCRASMSTHAVLIHVWVFSTTWKWERHELLLRVSLIDCGGPRLRDCVVHCTRGRTGPTAHGEAGFGPVYPGEEYRLLSFSCTSQGQPSEFLLDCGRLPGHDFLTSADICMYHK